MLLNPGPLDPIDVDAWTQPGEPSNLAGLAASLAASLDGHEGQLRDAQSTMITAPDADAGGAGAFELGDAETAHAFNSAEIDTAIGDVAAHADALEGEINGSANDAAGDIASSSTVDFGSFVPHAPDGGQAPYPPGRDPYGQDPGDQPDPSSDQFAQDVRNFYHDLLGREANDDDIAIHRGNPGGIEGVRDTILNSDEYKNSHGG